jgi:hypothetical protein
VLPEKSSHKASKRPAMPKAIPGTITAAHADEATVQAPLKAGLYRLYVWISDGKGHAATANAPFEVK